MRIYLVVILKLLYFSSIQCHPKVTIDEFFNVTSFESLSLSPNGQYLLVYSKRPAWDSDSFQHSLWLHETSGRRKLLISEQLSGFSQIKWAPSSKWFVYAIIEQPKGDLATGGSSYRHSPPHSQDNMQHLYFYNVDSNEVMPIDIGKQPALTLTWSADDSALYFSTLSSEVAKNDTDNSTEDYWKDVIVYRRTKASDGSTIYRIDVTRKHRKTIFTISPVTQLNFILGELVYVPSQHKLVGTSVAAIVEHVSDLEIYSIDLDHSLSITRLTNNQGVENSLKLSSDGKQVFYQVFSSGSEKGPQRFVQTRLHSIDMATGKIDVWGKDFKGSIREYAIRPTGGVYILGQLGADMQIYVQQSPSKYLISKPGWNGSYRTISSSTCDTCSSIAFLHSSFTQPEEVYITSSVDELCLPKKITHENDYLTDRDLPEGEVYQWINPEDDRTIEGTLRYPPGKFQHKGLPLLVLIHGGPTDASLNGLHPDWYNWGPLAASAGWLVLEPNYRGSTGYGDQFIDDIVTKPLSLPGKDILAGVDCLVSDGTADPSRLAIGGYSYGGFLTNWLITQTTRFNAALSGAGPFEHVSMWGTTDFPIFVPALLGGYPWETPEIYTKESMIFQLDQVVTPTLIVTGAKDIRVPPDQSLILERGLNYLEIPVNLLIFPNEGHIMDNNPWHGKIKVREELKWLEKYGHICAARTTK